MQQFNPGRKNFEPNPNGEVKVYILIKDELIWLTIYQMAELFVIDKRGIFRQIKNIFETGELEERVVVAKIPKA